MQRLLFFTFIILIALPGAAVLAQDGPQEIEVIGRGITYEVDWSVPYIAAATSTGVWVYDAASTTTVINLPTEEGRVTALAFSPFTRYLAAADFHDEVTIWDVRTWEIAHTLRAEVEDHLEFWDLAWSPDGRYLVGVGVTNTGEVSRDYGAGGGQVWDVETGAAVAWLGGHEALINSVAWSPDGAYLATGGWDETVRVWDTSTWQEAYRPAEAGLWPEVAWMNDQLVGLGFEVGLHVWEDEQRVAGEDDESFVGYSAAVYGNRIAIGTWGGEVLVWDGNTQTLRTIAAGLPAPVVSVAWAPDGSWVLTGSQYDRLHIWSAGSDTPVRVIEEHQPAVVNFAWGDQSVLATGPPLTIWKSPKEWTAFDYSPHAWHPMLWSADGSRLLLRTASDELIVVDRTSGAALLTVPSPETPRTWFSADGRVLGVYAERTYTAYEVATGEVIWEGIDIEQIVGVGAAGQRVCLRPVSFSGQHQIVDIVTRDVIHTYDVGAEGEALDVRWRAGGGAWLLVEAEGYIRVVDMASGDVLLEQPNPDDEPVYHGWSTDGTQLALHLPGGLDVYALPDGALIDKRPMARTHSLFQFSPDGRWLAAQTVDFVTVWEVGQAASYRITPEAPISRMRWSPDGRLGVQTNRSVLHIYRIETHQSGR